MPSEDRDGSASIERRTQNEVMYREVNKAIHELNESWQENTATPSAFVCECELVGCSELVQVPISEYERIRNDRTLFFVKVGHESEIDLERVVKHTDDFLVVQKRANELTA